MNSREVHCGVMQWGGASGVFGVHHRLSAEGAGEAKKARELMKKLFEIIGNFQAIPLWLARLTCRQCSGLFDFGGRARILAMALARRARVRAKRVRSPRGARGGAER